MRSQGLPSSFLPAHLGINYHPPSPSRFFLCDGFMSAGISRCGRPARHPANSRSSYWRCEVERLSPPVPAILIQLPSLDLLTSVSLPHRHDTCCMLRGERRVLTRPSSHRSDKKFSEPGPDSRTGGGPTFLCSGFEASGKALEIAPARVKSCSG